MPRRQIDAASDRASKRSRFGYSRELQQARTATHATDPSNGGSRGFPSWFRSRTLSSYHQTNDVRVAAATFGVCQQTVRNWIQRPDAFRMTGGAQREELVGRDLFLLVLGNFAYPKSNTDELSAFIVRNGGDVYNRQAVDERLAEVEYSKKHSSTEAYAAYSFRSMFRAEVFWTLPLPLGIVGIAVPRKIDTDETGWDLSGCGSHYGRTPVGVRARTLGHYVKSPDRVNLFMGIEPGDPNLPANVDGSIENPRRWIYITRDSCNAQTFSSFLDQMCTDIETRPAGPHDNARVVMWDNLKVHNSPLVIHTLEERVTHDQFRFQHLNRPPYQPKRGPIEYIFNEMSAELNRRVKRDWTTEILEQEIRQIASEIGRNGAFNRTFAFCGYA